VRIVVWQPRPLDLFFRKDYLEFSCPKGQFFGIKEIKK